MKKLFVYMKGYRTECVLAPLFKLIEALLELFVPVLVADIIDLGIGAGDRSFVFGNGAVFFRQSCHWLCLPVAAGGVFPGTGFFLFPD